MTHTNALPGGGLGQDPEEAAAGGPATPCPSCLGAGGMVSLGGKNSRDHTRQGPGIVSTMLWGAPGDPLTYSWQGRGPWASVTLRNVS